MPRKRPGFGHRRVEQSLLHSRSSTVTEPQAITAWREWLSHQYEPGYWVGTRIPPFLSGAFRGRARHGSVRWLLALPLLLLFGSAPIISSVWTFQQNDAQPKVGLEAVQRSVDFELLFPCALPETVNRLPAIASFSQPSSSTRAALITFQR